MAKKTAQRYPTDWNGNVIETLWPERMPLSADGMHDEGILLHGVPLLSKHFDDHGRRSTAYYIREPHAPHAVTRTQLWLNGGYSVTTEDYARVQDVYDNVYKRLKTLPYHESNEAIIQCRMDWSDGTILDFEPYNRNKQFGKDFQALLSIFLRVNGGFYRPAAYTMPSYHALFTKPNPLVQTYRHILADCQI